MSPRLRVACVQMNACSDTRRNFLKVRNFIARAASARPDLIALPENFLWRGESRQLGAVAGEAGGWIREFKKIAAERKTAILLGSLIEKSPGSKKFRNVSYLISKSGRIAARYEKIHLFDIRLPGLKIEESKTIEAGRKVVTAASGGKRFGFSICYDLRFPGLFRRVAESGALAVFVPANFTYETGKSHWEVLLRARAIENQIFVIAPAQSGRNPSSGVRSFGSSMIIDPWGKILARAGSQGEGIITADLDFRRQSQIRSRLPVLVHARKARSLYR